MCLLLISRNSGYVTLCLLSFVCYTGWKDDLSLWPDTDYGCIYTYLIEAPGPFNGEAMKAYKSLEAYNLFISGHVRECRYHPIGKNVKVCFLKAKVVPGGCWSALEQYFYLHVPVVRTLEDEE